MKLFTFNSKTEQRLTVLICILGISGVAYGMIKESDLIFIAGLSFVIGGYLIIRKKLKSSVRDK